MMQAAESWHGYDPATRIVLVMHFTTRRSSFFQREMSPVVVVIADVLVHQAFQMPFVEHDDMVEQITPAVADPTLFNAVLPRTAKAGSLRLDAEALYGLDYVLIEVRATIKDQVLGSRIVWKGLAELLHNPCTGRMPGGPGLT